MRHRHMNHRLFWIVVCLLVCMLAWVFLSSVGEQPIYLLIGKLAEPVRQVTVLIGDNAPEQMTLPAKITSLSPGTKVIVETSLTAEPNQSVLLKTVFAKVKLRINGAESVALGQQATYPAMMNDPPTIIDIVELPQQGGNVVLRMEYVSPSQRNELSLPVMYLGDKLSIFARLFVADGFSFLFSLLLVFAGLMMALFSITFVRRVPAGAAFLWLGLFACTSGIWGLGECDLSAFFIPYPTLLYDLAYLGLFCITICFLRFGLLVLQPHQQWPILIMIGLHAISIAIVMLLHIAGLMDFIRSLYWFHLIIPIGFITFAGCVLWEHIHYQNRSARRFAPAIMLISAAVVAEVLNYWLHFIDYFTLFFQLGVLGFVIALGIASSHYIQDSFQMGAEKALLEKEMEQAGQLLMLYKRQYESMTHTDLEERRQRHDLRHQLTVLRDLNRRLETDKLKHYIDGLIDALPGDPELRLCENHAVNAVATNYVVKARNAGIATDIWLQIPADTGIIQEIDLCVIVGNLLENAVEACMRIDAGIPQIRVHGVLKREYLSITCENSYNGETTVTSNGMLISSKRAGEGIGIRSVQAVVERYGGITRFEPGEDSFLSSVFVRMSEHFSLSR